MQINKQTAAKISKILPSYDDLRIKDWSIQVLEQVSMLSNILFTIRPHVVKLTSTHRPPRESNVQPLTVCEHDDIGSLIAPLHISRIDEV